jgi:protein O-GlcNAc transferase
MEQSLKTAKAHLRAGKFLDAQTLFEQVLAAEPDNPRALHGLGVALLLQNRHADAARLLGRAAALQPSNPGYHLNLSVALLGLHNLEQAAAALTEALRLKPDYPQAQNNLAQLLQSRGQVDAAIPLFDRAASLQPNDPTYASNRLLALHYLDHCDPAALFEEHRRWDQRFGRSPPPPHANSRDPDRRIRVGYVSANFRRHSVGYFFAPLLAHHDRAVVELYCYSGVLKSDEMTDQIRRAAHVYREITALSDDRLCALVRDDAIDILVDLSGHTSGNRLTAFTHKPAPVQVTYLGYPNTTGLAAIDYRLTDALADPPGLTESFHAEQLICLPDCAWCFQPWPDPGAPEPRPRDNGPITFGCFNVLSKLTDQTLELWSSILQRLPESRLLIKSLGLEDDTARRHLGRRLAAHAIPAERVELVGFIDSERDHMELYHRVDIALDTFPYHGTTTTCQSLWMGVPVVTLSGAAHMSRVGVSLLSNVGLGHLIAHTPREYVDIAVALAADPSALAEVRQTLRPTMLKGPLMDGPRLARGIESAYRQMWRRWCS